MTVTGPNAQAVKLVLPNGQGPSISLACNYFASAQTLSPCNIYYSPTPIIGETVRQLSAEEIQIIDEADVQGGGQLSGGLYVDQGVIIWVPGADLTGPGAQGNRGYALQADCALSPSQTSVCQAILNFVTIWYANPSNVGF